MRLLAVPDGIAQPFRQLTLEENLSLPEDTRAEIVDGVLRPMVRSNKKSREVQRRLASIIAEQKPGEYARNGIPSFWRVELEPDIAIHVHELVDGVYRDTEGVHRRGGLIEDPTLKWVSIEVNDLLGDYA